MLATNSMLEKLDLRDNHLGEQDALGLAFQEVFCSHVSQPTSAGEHRASLLNRRPDRGTSAQSDKDAMPGNDCLRRLHLANNELTSNSLWLLAESLPLFTSCKSWFCTITATSAFGVHKPWREC